MEDNDTRSIYTSGCPQDGSIDRFERLFSREERHSAEPTNSLVI